MVVNDALYKQTLTAAEAAAYVTDLVAAYPSIRQVWLYGSRANGTESDNSDWDYMAFADEPTLAALRLDTRFHRDGIDLMIVTDGAQFAKPWVDGSGTQKAGTLTEFGGLCWKLTASPIQARYRATKGIPGGGTKVFEQRALRVYIGR